MTVSVSILSKELSFKLSICTLEILLFIVSKSINLVLNKNFPPFDIINSLIFLIIFIKLSVPI